MTEIIWGMLLSRLHSPQGQKALSDYGQVTIHQRLPHFSSDWNPVTKVGWLYSKESCTEAYYHLKNPNDHIRVPNSLFRCVREIAVPRKQFKLCLSEGFVLKFIQHFLSPQPHQETRINPGLSCFSLLTPRGLLYHQTGELHPATDSKT